MMVSASGTIYHADGSCTPRTSVPAPACDACEAEAEGFVRAERCGIYHTCEARS